MTDPAAVLTEVKGIVSSISPQFDFAAMEANLAFLLEILKQDKQDFIRRLRRRGLPEYLKTTRRNSNGPGGSLSL